MFVLLHAGFNKREYRVRKPVRVEEGIAHASPRGHTGAGTPTVNTISEAMISVSMVACTALTVVLEACPLFMLLPQGNHRGWARYMDL
jgi:hypothetical protein